MNSFVTFQGDVMGPGLVHSNMGSWNALDKSSGQGETYIFDLALDLHWLRYLKVTDQLENNKLLRTLDEMNKGLCVICFVFMFPKSVNLSFPIYFSAHDVLVQCSTSYCDATMLSCIISDLTIVYSYMKDDGSFAMFRGRSLKSIWLVSLLANL